MLKNLTRNVFQKLLGFDNYLFVFALIHIFQIRSGLSEKAFRYFAGLTGEGGAILDIGANIGIMTVILARAHPSATIYSFEPIPESRKTLERVVRFYKLTNVKIFNTALGDANTEAEMVMPVAGTAKMQGLSHVVEPGKSEPGELYTIQMQKLDDVPELAAVAKINAIKIDVENFEYFVLKGGRALLEKHRPVVFCELWNNERRAVCLAFMEQLGYKARLFTGRELSDFTGQEALDFFFMP